MSASPILKLVDVQKTYPSPDGGQAVLKGIDLQVYPGEFVLIYGKSGAGKTTLVNMIAGIDTLTGGEVVCDGVSLHRLNESRRARFRGQKIGIIYQSFYLLPNLSLLDNVMLPMDFCRLFHPLRSPQRALHLLDSVELKDHAYKRPAAISGGQQQRVAIARALANDPPLIVADEPTGRLDSVTAETIIQIFIRLANEGKAVVMVTHDTSLMQRATRCLRLEEGRLHECQSPSQREAGG